MSWLVGYPREEVKWYPTIDSEKCVECGMCMNCGKKVFEWTKNGPKVVNPNDCVVGCTTCTNLCLGNAISHPDVSDLKEVYQANNIWAKVKEDLISKGKLDVD